MKNGEIYNYNQILQYTESKTELNAIAYSMSMDLREGDEINLQVTDGTVILGNGFYFLTPINFSGFLI